MRNTASKKNLRKKWIFQGNINIYFGADTRRRKKLKKKLVLSFLQNNCVEIYKNYGVHLRITLESK